MEKKGKEKKAAALSYDPESSAAPRMVAFGQGHIAEQIISIAQDANVPLQQNDELVEFLSHLKIGQEIPEELYEVVAEILAFVYNLSALE